MALSVSDNTKPIAAMMVFADPMCSWCYGFAPELEQIIKKYGKLIAMRPIMGGLRVGEQMPMDDGKRLEIRTHWNHVTNMSGQPFDFSFFEWEKFIYDTEPACQAVTAMRRIEDLSAPFISTDGEILKTSQKSFDFLAALHKAFYADGKNITDPDEIAQVAETMGVTKSQFLSFYHAPETQQQTHFDFQMTRQSEVKGFPTLILGDYEKGFQIVTQGYEKFNELDGKIAQYVAQKIGPLN